MGKAFLTSGNSQLTRVNRGNFEYFGEKQIAVNCTNKSSSIAITETLTDEAADLLRHSLSENTARAYRGDLDHFSRLGRGG